MKFKSLEIDKGKSHEEKIPMVTVLYRHKGCTRLAFLRAATRLINNQTGWILPVRVVKGDGHTYLGFHNVSVGTHDAIRLCKGTDNSVQIGLGLLFRENDVKPGRYGIAKATEIDPKTGREVELDDWFVTDIALKK